MKLTVNGKEIEFNTDLTVSKLLAEQNVKMPDMVSVELNGGILKRSEFEKTTLNEGDKIEFLYFMGGGNVINPRTNRKVQPTYYT
ncbi:MAG: sulfur carrier protein ThiS [Planctomycetota bacterium]|jgi:sulfur carrier protein